MGSDHGLEVRDYEKDPLGSQMPICELPDIPRGEWRGRIEYHKENKLRPLDFHRQVPILNQASLRFCWCFAPVAGVMNRLSYQGIDPVPELSAAAIASQFKGGRNVGGTVAQGVEACLHGIPSAGFWPNDKLKESGFDKAETDASFNSLATFTELGANQLDRVISVLLGDGPRPVAIALPWWRHAVLALAVDYSVVGRQYGLIYANSYGPNWKEDGFGILWGKKAIGHENIVIESAVPRSE